MSPLGLVGPSCLDCNEQRWRIAGGSLERGWPAVLDLPLPGSGLALRARAAAKVRQHVKAPAAALVRMARTVHGN
jgi:hypothetical protein